jgi:hypothetical protein
MNDYKVYENQNLQDIAAHIYGRVDVVVDLALLNNLSITEKLQSGQVIKLVDAPINILVKKALDSREIIPATLYASQPNYELENYLLPNIFPIML